MFMGELDCSKYALNEALFLADLKRELFKITRAWLCLYQLYRIKIMSHHQYLEVDDPSREEAFQDAVLLFWDKLRAEQFMLMGQHAIPRFLSVVFNNMLRDRMKGTRSLGIVTNWDPRYTDLPDENVESRITQNLDFPLRIRRLEKILSQLPRRQQELMLLMYVFNKDKDEIIQEMQISEENFRNLKYKALKSLRQFYQNESLTEKP